MSFSWWILIFFGSLVWVYLAFRLGGRAWIRTMKERRREDTSYEQDERT